jgi:uncharacterized protein (DUF779 family)
MTAITATVIATEAARELIGTLYAGHGPISLHVSGSYGVSVVCLTRSELKIGSRDVHMGDVQWGVRLSDAETVPLYFMTSEVEYWAGSTVVIDIARGVAAGFSLEGPHGVHFTLRKRANPSKRIWDADAILAGGAPAATQPRTRTDD